MPIIVENKRKKIETLAQRYPSAHILDVTSRGVNRGLSLAHSIRMALFQFHFHQARLLPQSKEFGRG